LLFNTVFFKKTAKLLAINKCDIFATNHIKVMKFNSKIKIINKK